MKKKITIFLLVLVLCLSMATPVFAVETDGFADEYYRVLDMAELLSESEEAALLEKLDEISLRQSVDVTVVTAEDLAGYDKISDYAEAIYEYCSFGYGEDQDGVLLLINMEDHDWYIAARGYGITAFTDAGIQYMGKQMKADLSEGDYAAAFDTYAGLCDQFITQAKNGTPYDKGTLPRELLSAVWIPISIGIGVMLALIIVGGMKRKLKTVRSQSAADSYVKNGSMNITESRDLFLYRTVTRSEKTKNNSSSGSSTHKSSSGATYGGGGGKF